VARLDLYDLLIRGDKTGDARLLPEDVIFIPPAGPLVAIAGNVRLPALYELKAETRATELIALAGGINEVGFRNRLQLLRVEEGKEQRLIELDLEQVMAGADLELQGGDVLKVYAVAAIVERTVHVTGPVKNPGLYGLKPGMRVSDLLRCTGGLLRYASREAELSRIRVTQQGPQTERFAVDLAAAAAGDPAHDLQLEGDDYLFVRSVPEWETQQVVTLSGQVRYPGAYAIARGERLSHLLERAGGFTGLAYLKGAVFTRLSAKKLQQQRLQESIDRLEEELLLKSAGTVQAALSPEEATQAESAAARRQGLIARLRTAEAQGRVTIRLQEPARLRGTPSDLTLEAGDALSVPQRPEFVQVMGSVYNPAAFIYDPGATVGSYLKKAGDPTAEADEDSIYVLKADGTVVSKRQGGWFGARWDGGWMGGFYSVRIDPGDTLVVPVELDRVNWLREVKDLTQVLYQIAITAGIMFIAF
jgi:protein involved in polysaccharide export with SLBB domain